ncbi:MAG: efflux RND transporter permease subunit, partial [Planctomycetota bacterium]
VMIDYTNYLKKKGQPLFEAVVQAGRTRLRPVLLTAITTTLSLAPMAMKVNVDFCSLLVGDFDKFGIIMGGEGSEMWAPLATAVMFGLMIATVLTLVLVPAAYVVTAQWSEKASDIYNRLLGRIDEPQQISDE